MPFRLIDAGDWNGGADPVRVYDRGTLTYLRVLPCVDGHYDGQRDRARLELVEAAPQHRCSDNTPLDAVICRDVP